MAAPAWRVLPAKALSQTLQNRFNYDAADEYGLHSVRDFHALNLEREAQFVEDYYVARLNGENVALREGLLAKAGLPVNTT